MAVSLANLQMDDALRRQPIMVTLRYGMLRPELTLRHSNTLVACIHWNSSPMAILHLGTGTSHHCTNVPRVFIMSAISASDHASSSYTDYDAFVMLDHVHFILYTLLEDSHKLYLDLNIDDFNRLCLKPIKYFKCLAWRILGVLGDILLDHTTVVDEEKLCNRSGYRFESAEDTGE